MSLFLLTLDNTDSLRFFYYNFCYIKIMYNRSRPLTIILFEQKFEQTKHKY